MSSLHRARERPRFGGLNPSSIGAARLYEDASRLRCTAGAARPRGFSLLEVLIALVVLSLGVLGLAALQMTTVQFNQSAYLRSQATSLAYDFADRIRANRRAALTGAYDGVDFAAPAPACAAPGGDTVAERDIAAWHSALACALPLGNGRIRRNGAQVTVSVRWYEGRIEAPADALETFEMTTSL